MPPESTPETVRKFLSHLPLFQALTPHHLDEIAAGAKEIRLEKGETLFHRGDVSTGFHVVVFGQLQLSINSPQGGKKIVEGQIGGSVSRNPVFGFKMKGAKAGDKVVVSWVDNKGDKRSDEAVIA